MKILKFNNEEEWLEARKGRITGTRLGDLLSKRDKKPLIGYYELIAERIAIPANGENVMDRGNRLEDEALDRFTKETGIKLNKDKVLWHRDEDENIAISPDGATEDLTEAVDAKCLSSAKHLQAYITKTLPSDYTEQKIQYFIVNDTLQTLHFAFYDPRMPLDFFYLTFTRAELQKEIDDYLELERKVLAEVADYEKLFTF